MKPLLTILALIVLIFLSKSLYQWWAKKGEVEAPGIKIQTVKVKEAEMPTLIETVGNLTSQKEAKIKSIANGKVGKILVEGGSFVKEGSELVKIIGGPEVRAPFDGYLSDWLVKEGEFVTQGTEMVDVVNTDVLSLNYRVPESFANELELGQEVFLNVRAFKDREFQGKLSFIAPMIDKKTYTIQLRAEVLNSEQILWPGMSTAVKHILIKNPKALVIPESTLIVTLEGYDVLCVAQGKLERRSVMVGTRNQGRVHILSGLTLGDSVLLTQAGLAEEGAKVIAEDWDGDW